MSRHIVYSQYKTKKITLTFFIFIPIIRNNIFYYKLWNNILWLKRGICIYYNY